MDLGKRVEAVVESSGQSRHQVANRCGVAQPRLHNIIHGITKNPSVDTIVRIAKGTGVSVDWLATGEGKMYRAPEKVDEMSLVYQKLLAIGGPPTEEEIGLIKMLRKIERKDKDGYRAILTQIMLCHLAIE